MFNTLFTSLPVIFMGIFEKDLSATTLLAVPELYNYGQLNRGFNLRIYLGWMLLATTQAMMTYFAMFELYAPQLTANQTKFALGCLTYSVCVTVISCKIQLLEMHDKSVMAAISLVLSIGGWFLWNMILSVTYSDNTIHYVKDALLYHFGRDLDWWLVYFFAVAICLLLDALFIAVRTTFWPTDVDKFQEMEQSPEMRLRLERAANHEAVQAILDRPRDDEEGKLRVAGVDEDVEAIVARRFGDI